MAFPHNTHPGRFIVVEGIDGSGLTTQSTGIVRELRAAGTAAFQTKEPTDGPAGGVLRLALTKRLGLTAETFALLFAADRMDHLNADVIPRLKMGTTVVCDRYIFSNIAYQGVELGQDWIQALNEKSILPDLTIFLDVPPETCMKRIYARQARIEHFEDVDTLSSIRTTFLSVLRRFRQEHDASIAVVDGSNPIEMVTRDIMRHVMPLFRT